MIDWFSNLPEKKLIQYFKQACIAEGITCILLYLVAMPLKYEFGIWWQMIPIGSLHGLFFVAYLVLTVAVRKPLNWDDEDFVFALLASLFPFGTFWVEKNLIKKNSSNNSD